MANYNKVILIGNLTRDPEVRYTPKGMAITKIALAINRYWRDTNTGEQKEEVTFVDLDAFGKQAETLSKYVRKGSPIMVEGRLRLDTWEDKQTNQKRSRLGVVIENFQFLGGNRVAEDGGPVPPSSRPAPAAPAAAVPPAGAPNPPGEVEDAPASEDDVPF
jgi:single-strand DNA-binding protein